MTFIYKYWKCAYTYGFLRKISSVYGTSYYMNNKETPLLFTDYLLMCNFTGFKAIFASPLYILNDIKCCEIKLRNLDYNNFVIRNYENIEQKKYNEIFYDNHLNLIG